MLFLDCLYSLKKYHHDFIDLFLNIKMCWQFQHTLSCQPSILRHHRCIINNKIASIKIVLHVLLLQKWIPECTAKNNVIVNCRLFSQFCHHEPSDTAPMILSPDHHHSNISLPCSVCSTHLLIISLLSLHYPHIHCYCILSSLHVGGPILSSVNASRVCVCVRVFLHAIMHVWFPHWNHMQILVSGCHRDNSSDYCVCMWDSWSQNRALGSHIFICARGNIYG